MSKARPVRHAARQPEPIFRRQLITLAAAATALQVKVATVRGYISSGHLTGYRIGSRMLRVNVEDVERLARELPTWRRQTASVLRAAEVREVIAQATEAEWDLQTRIRP